MKRDFTLTGFVCPKIRQPEKTNTNGFTLRELNTKIVLAVLVLIFSTFTLQAQRVTSDLQALYDFTEGSGNTVASSVGVGPDLTIANPTNVSWLPNGCGVSVNSETIIRSNGGTAALKQALQSTNEITIEAWIKPANTTQNGPARIFTMSGNSSVRNFTIGQGSSSGSSKYYITRLRTTNTTVNGNNPELRTSNNTASSSEIQHVVFTHASDGTERMYVNGVLEDSDTRTGNFSNWDNYELAFANEFNETGRSWRGDIYLGAIYNRDLSANEVIQNYNEGLCFGSVGTINIAQQPEDDYFFGCGAGQTVDLYGSGVDCSNTPHAEIIIPNPSNVYQVVVEIVYKGANPGNDLTIFADGEDYILQKVSLNGVSPSVYAFRGLIPNSVTNIGHNSAINGCGSNHGLQSVAVYAFRNVEKNSEISAVFTAESGYCDIVDFQIPINTNANARDVIVTLPISELTLDGRYLKVYASAGGKSDSQILYAPDGGCCFGAPILTLEDVPGHIDEVNIEVQTDRSNNPFYWGCGQSWVMAGLAVVEVVCPYVGIADVDVSNCIDQPLQDIATVTTEIEWLNPTSNIIELTHGNKTEVIDISSLNSPYTFEFNIEADGSTGNVVSIDFKNGNDPFIATYNAPSACSNDELVCDVLYISGLDKPEDGGAWDNGLIEYISEISDGIITHVTSINGGSGYGLYDPNNTSGSVLNIDLDDYEMIIISSSTQGSIKGSFINTLKTVDAGILNFNYLVMDDLGLTSNAGDYAWQSRGYYSNLSYHELYNFDNPDSWFGNVVTYGDYYGNADAELWQGQWDALNNRDGIFFSYESTDALPGVASHGPRVYLGLHPNGIYANAENAGAYPVPQAEWFNPVTHLTLEGKKFLDLALIDASSNCTDCPDPIVSGISAPTTTCAVEDALFIVDPAVAGATYSWTFSDDASIAASSATSVNVQWASVGVKNITLTVTKDGCEETYNETINITEEVFAIAGPDRTICRGASTVLGATPSGNGAATYLWTPNLFLNDNTVANPVATPPVTMTYTLYVTLNGCTRTDDVTVVVDVSLSPIVEAGFEAAVCDTINDPVQLGADPIANISYQWSTAYGDIIGATSSYYTVQAKTTTVYYVTGTNIHGCTGIDSTRITVIPCREICNNGIDDDGDGQIDCEDGDCDYVPGCIPENFHADPTITAQRYDRWTFGDEIDIEFTKGLPEIDPNGARIATTESSNTFTGPNGEMMFYTDGISIYNRNNDVMDGGADIGGSNGVINSSVSFQDPKNDDRMYLFATANDNDQGGSPLTESATYSYINMHAHGGLGKIIRKVQPISGTSEGLTSIPHRNGRDVWVITADKNSSVIYTTLVNRQGVQASIPHDLTLGNGTGFPQEINIIGNGQHDMLAVGCYFDEVLVLYDFDNATGVITNKKEVVLQERVYGLEFSPNGKYLYVSSYGDQSLFQLQINDSPAAAWKSLGGTNERIALSEAQIVASRINISQGLGNYGHLQIGPDGRIYCPVSGVSLGAILNPNGGGIQSGWDASVMDIPGVKITGALPNFMNGGCFRTSFLLPVEFTYFTASPDGNNANLEWETASELNNDYFLVQRSSDAYSWENIGEVDGNGTTITSINYDFIDAGLEAGTYYYRLMQVDFDGIFDYSEIKSVEITGTSNFKALSIAPNPVASGSFVSIKGGSRDLFQIRLMNLNGQILFESTGNSRTISIADLNLSPGVYMIEIVDGTVNYTEQLIVQ